MLFPVKPYLKALYGLNHNIINIKKDALKENFLKVLPKKILFSIL
jgi:hypothetical protein